MCRKVVSLAVEDAMPAMPKEEQVALKFAVLHPKPTYWWVFLIIALLIIALIVIFCLCKKSNSAATNNNVIAVRRVPDKTPNLSYEEPTHTAADASDIHGSAFTNMVDPPHEQVRFGDQVLVNYVEKG